MMGSFIKLVRGIKNWPRHCRDSLRGGHDYKMFKYFSYWKSVAIDLYKCNKIGGCTIDRAYECKGTKARSSHFGGQNKCWKQTTQRSCTQFIQNTPYILVQCVVELFVS